MEKHPLNFQSLHCDQHAILLQRASGSGRRLLLLHGAGVAGEITWTYVANYLTEWDEILIPDFAGMGKSRFLHQQAPRLGDYVQQIEELLSALDWSEYDVAGYSFGGLVAEYWLRDSDFRGLCFLLEPAMLFSADCLRMQHKAAEYLTVADQIDACADNLQPYRDFLDSVSPHRERHEKSEQITIARLQENATGFAQSLRAVSQALLLECDYYRQWISPWPGVSFVGGLSYNGMQERHYLLARQSRDWHCEIVAGADHSLVFTKPRTIARVMNERSRQRDVSALQASL